MPRIIESAPPTIVGFADIDFSNEIFSMPGGLDLTVKDGEREAFAFDDPEVAEMLAGTLEPIWRATDADIRELHSLRPDATTHHRLRYRPDSETRSVRSEVVRVLLQDMAVVKENRVPTPPGLVHIDIVEYEDEAAQAVKNNRYTYHTSSSTEFFLGNQWFVPSVRSWRTGGNLKKLLVGAGVQILNLPALWTQSAFALRFQPPAGSIVRNEGQVHRRAKRYPQNDKVDMVVLDDVNAWE